MSNTTQTKYLFFELKKIYLNPNQYHHDVEIQLYKSYELFRAFFFCHIIQTIECVVYQIQKQ